MINSLEVVQVHIDKDKVRTQEEEVEAAPMDQVEERVEAEMKEMEARAKESVAEGLKDTDTKAEEEQDK
ncbi:MAG TPA: hypothetical protein VF779_15825 [Pyrinomonadaceae bacterium]